MKGLYLKNKLFSFEISIELLNNVKAYCKEAEMSVACFIRLAIIEYLKSTK